MLRLFTLVLLLTGFYSTSSLATTEWSEGFGYKARLITGDRNSDGSFEVAFEVVLEDGWKTYWRVPGENGIPPLMNFENSSNVENIDVHWPTPIVFRDQGAWSVGYKKHMVLPLTVTPQSTKQAVDFNMGVFFGVCSEICVPADERFSVLLQPDAAKSPYQPLINEALIQVPASDAKERPLAVSEVSLNTGDKSEFIEMHLKVPAGAHDLTVLTEGPEDWYFDPYREQVSVQGEEDDIMTVKIPLHRLFKDPLTGDEKLRVTLIVDSEAIETTIALK